MTVEKKKVPSVAMMTNFGFGPCVYYGRFANKYKPIMWTGVGWIGMLGPMTKLGRCEADTTICSFCKLTHVHRVLNAKHTMLSNIYNMGPHQNELSYVEGKNCGPFINAAFATIVYCVQISLVAFTFVSMFDHKHLK